ncbi:MAG TPA: DUF4349 domain-containing protein, partial [Dehalococcoidales bacterium]|nr:DUF4349 domain-containing protein [Dehalococcoidales bacterium]
MKKLIAGILVGLILVGTAACAAAPKSAPVPAPAPSPVPAPMPPESSGLFGGRDTVVVQTPPPVISLPPAPSPTPTPVPAPKAPVEVSQTGQPWEGDRMIIRTGDMSLVVTDVAAAIEQITRLAASYNGFVVSSNTWQERERMMGNISIRVDASSFDDAIRALRGLGVEVRQESTSGQDVTEEYVDLSSRLKNLEAAEAQLLKLMEQAGKVSDILEVQRELVKTRGEIEQTRGRMQYLEQSSSMSFIQVRLEQSKLTVEFSADSRNVKEGVRVQFYPNISGGFAPYGFEWAFGDGDTSTDEAPSHAYRSDGTFTVSLKVTDDRGNKDTSTRSDYITVLPGWSAGNIAGGAWNGLVGFGRVIADIIIWLGIFSPVWIIIG